MKAFLTSASIAVFILFQSFNAGADQTHNHDGHNHSGHNHSEHSDHGGHEHKKAHKHGEHSHDAAHSGVSKDGTIHIHNGWTRATVKTAKVGGGYLSITNTSDTPDRLISVDGTISNRIEIHQMKLVDNVMQMRPLPQGIEIPAGGEVVLKPGAEHIMFMGLHAPLQKGEIVNVTLNFERAGAVAVELDINSISARSHSGEEGHSENGGHGGHNHSGHNH